MRKIWILLILLLFVFSACSQGEEEIFTSATIRLTTADSISVEKVQATLKATNINTRQTVTTSQFDSLAVPVTLLRGAYKISIEGYAVYKDKDQQQHTQAFRAYTDYCELIELSSEAEIELILM
jgi:hypothetical protein